MQFAEFRSIGTKLRFPRNIQPDASMSTLGISGYGDARHQSFESTCMSSKYLHRSLRLDSDQQVIIDRLCLEEGVSVLCLHRMETIQAVLVVATGRRGFALLGVIFAIDGVLLPRLIISWPWLAAFGSLLRSRQFAS